MKLTFDIDNDGESLTISLSAQAELETLSPKERDQALVMLASFAVHQLKDRHGLERAVEMLEKVFPITSRLKNQ